MNTHDNSSIKRDTQFSLCLPAPRTNKSNKNPNNTSQKLNPFPLITDLHRPHSILPIKSYWFPATARENDKDILLFSSHESVHLSLLNTPIGVETITLIHYQYIALATALIEGKSISLPSLRDSTGYIAQAQHALDLIDFPMALIHELMALTLVQIYLENNKLFITPVLLQGLLKSIGCPFPEIFKLFSPEMLNSPFLIVPSSFDAGERLQSHQDSWFEFYSGLFDDYCSEALGDFNVEGKKCTFRQLYERLLGSLRTIVSNLSEEEWVQILPFLIRYPFTTDRPIHDLVLPSKKARFDYQISCLIRMSQELIKRLKNLIVAIETAPRFNKLSELIPYLMVELPNYFNTLGVKDLSQIIKKLWWQHDQYFGEIIELVYRNEIDVLIGFTQLPLYSAHDLFKSNDLAIQFRELTVPIVALETWRQSLIVMRSLLAHEENFDFHGLPCLCASYLQAECPNKINLDLLWQLVIPDPGYEYHFNKYWQKPVCTQTMCL